MSDISWNKRFLAVLALESDLVPNQYEVNLTLTPNTSDIQEQNIAFERISVLFESVFNNSVFVSVNNEKLPLLIEEFDSNMVFLPDDPHDQILNVLFYAKVNAVLEGRFFIRSLAISSFQGEWVSYIFTEDMTFPEIFTEKVADREPWWLRPDLQSMDIIVQDAESGKEKLMKYELSWKDLDLQWDWGNDEKEGKVITLNKFKPKIIDGGNNEDR